MATYESAQYSSNKSREKKKKNFSGEIKDNCSICGIDLKWYKTDLSKMNHEKECAERRSVKESPFLCSICGKNITRYNEDRRAQHLNRCAVSVIEKENVDIFGEKYRCVICEKNLNKNTNRGNHMKNCAKKHGVTPQKIVELEAAMKEKNSRSTEVRGDKTLVIDIAPFLKKEGLGVKVKIENESEEDLIEVETMNNSIDLSETSKPHEDNIKSELWGYQRMTQRLTNPNDTNIIDSQKTTKTKINNMYEISESNDVEQINEIMKLDIFGSPHMKPRKKSESLDLSQDQKMLLEGQRAELIVNLGKTNQYDILTQIEPRDTINTEKYFSDESSDAIDLTDSPAPRQIKKIEMGRNYLDLTQNTATQPTGGYFSVTQHSPTKSLGVPMYDPYSISLSEDFSDEASDFSKGEKELFELKKKEIENEYQKQCKLRKDSLKRKIDRLKKDYYAEIGLLSTEKEKKINGFTKEIRETRNSKNRKKRRLNDNKEIQPNLKVAFSDSILEEETERFIQKDLKKHQEVSTNEREYIQKKSKENQKTRNDTKPNYQAMTLAELKELALKFGIRPGSKKQLVEILNNLWEAQNGTITKRLAAARQLQQAPFYISQADSEDPEIILRNEITTFLKEPSNESLFNQILQTQNLDIKLFQSKLKESNIKASLNFLKSYFRRQGISTKL